MPTDLDLVCVGRACVDIYSEQDGARLESVESFQKYLGGSAANICVGAARLGLKTAMLTGIGQEAFGRFVHQALEAEGIDTSMVRRDPKRLTALVALAIREVDDFPRIFYYTDSADLALSVNDVDWNVIERSKAALITGTYLTAPALRELTMRLADFCRSRSIKVILDIDFRPVLWGLAAVGEANRMHAQSGDVTSAYQAVLPLCDLVVGTADEVLIAGGGASVEASISAIRELTRGTMVLKRGQLGCSILSPATKDKSIDVAGFPIRVINSVGAGDAFMSGFVAGWLRNETLEECGRLGNACGALVVSRHGCTPAMPSQREVDYFLANHERLRDASTDAALNSLHRATIHRARRTQTLVLAFDHRWQLEEVARQTGSVARLSHLKGLIYEGFLLVSRGRNDVGILVDETYGRDILERASGSGIWIGRAMDIPRSFPVRLGVNGELTNVLRRWPTDNIVKVLCYAHPTDPPSIMKSQLLELKRLHDGCIAVDREFLIELQPSPGKSYGDHELAVLMDEIYAAGIRPDWWKLPPHSSAESWRSAGDTIRDRDPDCRGMLVLGQTSTAEELQDAFRACAAESLCAGFAVGRGIFMIAAQNWLNGAWSDAQVIDSVAERFQWYITAWESAHGRAKD